MGDINTENQNNEETKLDNTNIEDNKNTEKKDDDSGKVVFNNQDEFNAIINRKVAKILKAKEKEFEDQKKKDSMNEVDKVKLERDQAIQKSDQKEIAANKKLIRAEVTIKSNELGIVDAGAAYKLIKIDDIDVDDSGKVSGVTKALKLLIADCPWLLKTNHSPKKTGDDTKDTKNNDKTTKTSGLTFNDVIRRAAKRF